MKKFEKAFEALCIAVILCDLLLATVSLQLKGEFLVAIIAFAFSLLLASIYHFLPRLFQNGIETEVKDDLKVKDSFPDYKICKSAIADLDKRVQKFEALLPLYEKLIERIKRLEENFAKLEKELLNKEDNSKDSYHLPVPLKEKAILQEEHVKIIEEKPKEYLVNIDMERLGNKNELTIDDKFEIYRSGAGIYLLNYFGELKPKNFQIGETFTSQLYDIFKHNMEKLFSLNTQCVIGCKITKIVPAKVHLSKSNTTDRQLEGILKEKGRIEVDISEL